jgi:putative acetyltransferase
LILDQPQEMIIDTGGFIFLAAENEFIVGTAALIKTGSHEFELAKMTVATSHRGKGISKLLIEKCIAQAKSAGASHLHLVSNHQLKEAITLYEKYGFKHTPLKAGPFLTADISMELNLTGYE